jgi:plastocyanin domain-containing protein
MRNTLVMSRHASSSSDSGSKLLIIVAVVFGCVVIFLLLSLNLKVSGTDSVTPNQGGAPVTEVNGTQYIDMTAKGGYYPNSMTAKSGIKTVLRVNTSGTYDCSSSLVIPNLGYRNTLPASGTTEIDIPPQSPNSEIRGSCSMGMYRFVIRFI